MSRMDGKKTHTHTPTETLKIINNGVNERFISPDIMQTVETVVRTKDIVLAPSFRCSRVVGPGKDFAAIWIPFGLSRGLSPRCDPWTFVPM